MVKYTIVTDSHYRIFLKEEGFGFIAEIRRTPQDLELQLVPMNKGTEMNPDDLVRIAKETLNQ